MLHRFSVVALAASLMCAPACIDDDPDISSEQQHGYTWNGYTWNGYTWNGYTWNGYTWNGLIHFDTTLAYFKENPLNAQTYSQRTDQPAMQLRQQLIDPLTQEFMGYLVSCALAPDQAPVKWQHPHPSRAGEILTFHGGLGLCPEWADDSIAGNEACQQKVSACLLARNNPYGITVPMSLRGPGGDGPIELADVLPAVADVASLEGCTANGDVNCGWTADFVGVCTPGTSVRFSASACGGSQLLRVCEGVGACDKGGDRYLAKKSNICQGGLSVTCPSSGIYSLMKRHYYGSRAASLRLHANRGSYPASELDVFQFAEGSFFGTVFDPNGLGVGVYIAMDAAGNPVPWYRVGAGPWQQQPTPPTTQVLAHKKMFACNSPGWDEDTRLDRFRVCAGPPGEEQCAARWVGNCLGTDDYPGQSLPSADAEGRCAREDSLEWIGDGDYDDCVAGTPDDVNHQLWKYPLTVYLTDACALAPPGEVCEPNAPRPPVIVTPMPLPPLPISR